MYTHIYIYMIYVCVFVVFNIQSNSFQLVKFEHKDSESVGKWKLETTEFARYLEADQADMKEFPSNVGHGLS